jgi:hypothetical protein
MKVSLNLRAARRTSFGEYALRFVLGGLVTVGTGLIAEHYGPVIGGLFLAFPAILPASISLVAKHERQKKQQAGVSRPRRGRQAAGLDAAGAALGSIGLAAFAVAIWKLLPGHGVPLAFACGLALWLAVSTALWWLRKHHFGLRRVRTRGAA